MLNEKINTAIDTVNNVSDLVASQKERITKYIVNGILLLVILIVFGCFDFATLHFHYEYLQDLSYWVGVTTKAIADICSFNIGINFIIDDVIKRDKILSEVKSLYEKLNAHRQSDFEYFVINIYNVKLKKRAYIAKINKLIYKLNKKAKSVDKILYSSDKPEHQPLKETNKYCIRRKQLEYLKSEEYIDKNIASLDVKFQEVDPAVFEIEIDGTQKVESAKVNGSVGKARTFASINVVFGVVMVSILTTSIVLEADKEKFENEVIQTMHYMQKALSDIGIVLWQFIHGMLKTKGIVSKELMAPYAQRVSLLKEYYAWRKAKGEWVPNCYLELTTETDLEEIVMTEEEFKKAFEK